ncbi:MAG TPA: pilus assembly protein TadG-related protein [Candidatus Baltobacteraceae bacterium]|nr:pilus assembly protein TadG-related protein [Candidatus Baltobacteraceae bacterium]
MQLTRHSRGQTLPLWSLGIGLALVIAFAAVQYGQVLRWQIRAQNAADAAAAGALSVQTQQWNEQLAMVYAASVEEYRLEELLQGMMLAANNDTRCQAMPQQPGSQYSGCVGAFVALSTAYKAALARYTADVQLVSRTSQYTFANAENDANAIIADFQTHCGSSSGGDCAFSYTVTNISPRSNGLNDVEMSGNVWAINDGLPGTPKLDYTPAQIEIVTCAKVPPIVPSFLGFTPPTFTAVGRAAATSAMVEQEWLDPGVIVNPATGLAFQPPATYATGGQVESDGKDWFTVNYGGNPAKAYASADAFTVAFQADEFTAVTGWWSTIPIKPYMGTLSDSQYACKS